MNLKNKFGYILIFLLLIFLSSSILFGCSGNKVDSKELEAQTESSAIQTDAYTNMESTDTSLQDITTHPTENVYFSKSNDFTNYSFICPEGWRLFETGSGNRLILINENSSGDKTESIFIFVDDLQNNSELNTDADIISTYNKMSEDEPTVEKFEEEIVKVDDDTAKLVGYKYESKLENIENLEIFCIDYFTFLRKANYLYSIKYMGRDINIAQAAKTFKDFLSTFKFGNVVEGVKEKDENSSVNILILGDDSGMERHGGKVNGRTDIIIIVHLNLDTCKGTAVTIPRDTWVNIPGHGEGKINGAHAIGGNELTIQTIEELSGLEIDNYIITDFDGFIPLIDFLGGVTVEVGEDLSDDFS